MGPVEAHQRGVELWQSVVSGVGDEQWPDPTPCADWDVRSLVGHVTGEELWTVELLAGRTIGDVGDALDGDLLGADPRSAAERAGRAASEAFAAPGAGDRTVQLSYGPESAAEYAWQLSLDHLVHGWDLAVATGQDGALPGDLVAAVADWFAEREEVYRGAGVIAERVALGGGHGPQDDLLAATGRDPGWAPSR